MNKEPKKRYITDREEPTYDIRNVWPDIIDEITIIGDMKQIFSKKHFNYLSKNGKIAEYGYDGEVQFIKLQNLFTIDDIKKKIEEICKGE